MNQLSNACTLLVILIDGYLACKINKTKGIKCNYMIDSGNVQFGQLFDGTVHVDVECNKRMVNDENRVHLLAIAFVFIAFCCVSC